MYQLGAVYKFTPHIATFANYSESFRPQMSVATPVSGDLKPEQGKSFEIGAKYENSGFMQHLHYSISVNVMWLKSLVLVQMHN